MWEKKNGNNHTQVLEVVNVLDAYFDTESDLSMLVPGKKDVGDDISQTSHPKKKSKTNYLPKNGIYIDSCSAYISSFDE